MRYGSLSGRLVLISPDGRALDVETASNGRFAADPQAVYARWPEFLDWARSRDFQDARPFARQELRAPVPSPRQLFAVALNYHSHAEEVGQVSDAVPPVFTKFVSSITGPYADVVHPGGSVDWEVELVVVIAGEGRNIPAADAWDHIAGLTVGQDISERELQHAGVLPQFSLGKSFPGFTPMGPWVVTPDELPDRDNLDLECWLNGELMQKGRTSEMILSVSELVARISAVATLLPGDVIYTGTPAGIGMSRTPPRYLAVGDVIATNVSGIGELETSIVAADGGTGRP